MAINITATIQCFQALSSDAWPSSPPAGSTLHIIDTGEEYVYHDGAWEQDLRRINAIKMASI